MSNNTNTDLYEAAADLIDYYEGTLHARLIERAMDSNDLEALLYHVGVAKAERALESDWMLGDGDAY